MELIFEIGIVVLAFDNRNLVDFSFLRDNLGALTRYFASFEYLGVILIVSMVNNNY